MSFKTRALTERIDSRLVDVRMGLDNKFVSPEALKKVAPFRLGKDLQVQDATRLRIYDSYLKNGVAGSAGLAKYMDADLARKLFPPRPVAERLKDNLPDIVNLLIAADSWLPRFAALGYGTVRAIRNIHKYYAMNSGGDESEGGKTEETDSSNNGLNGNFKDIKDYDHWQSLHALFNDKNGLKYYVLRNMGAHHPVFKRFVKLVVEQKFNPEAVFGPITDYGISEKVATWRGFAGLAAEKASEPKQGTYSISWMGTVPECITEIRRNIVRGGMGYQVEGKKILYKDTSHYVRAQQFLVMELLDAHARRFATDRDLEVAAELIGRYHDPSNFGLHVQKATGEDSQAEKNDGVSRRDTRRIIKQKPAEKKLDQSVWGGEEGALFVETEHLAAYGFSSRGETEGRINQDSMDVADGRLFQVGDGIGGNPGGEKASRFVLQEMATKIINEGMGFEEAAAVTVNGMEKSLPYRAGTTYAGVLIEKNEDGSVEASVATSGDSQVVVVHSGNIVVSVPHTVSWQESFELGTDDLEKLIGADSTEASQIINGAKEMPISREHFDMSLRFLYPHVFRNATIVNSFITGFPQVYLDINNFKLESGDMVILCSDGVSNNYSPIDLVKKFSDSKLPLDMQGRIFLSDALRSQVNGRKLDVGLGKRFRVKGARDNLTFIVIKIK